MSFPLTTTTRNTCFRQREEIRLVLKFSKSKSNKIVTKNSHIWHFQYSVQLQRLLHLFLHAHVIINYFGISRRNRSDIGILVKSFQPKLTDCKNIEANIYQVVYSQYVYLRKSCFFGCINPVSHIIKRFCCNIRFDCFYEVFLWHLDVISLKRFPKVMQIFFWALFEGSRFGFNFAGDIKSC